MTDKEELRNLADRCKMWASHPVPFAGSFGDVVADGATVKDWGAVPELTPPSSTEPSVEEANRRKAMKIRYWMTVYPYQMNHENVSAICRTVKRLAHGLYEPLVLRGAVGVGVRGVDHPPQHRTTRSVSQGV